jgi:hypothetical protein
MRNIVIGMLQAPLHPAQLQRLQFIQTGFFDGFDLCVINLAHDFSWTGPISDWIHCASKDSDSASAL